MLTTARTLFFTFLLLCLTTLSIAKYNKFPLEIIDLSTGTVSNKLIHEVKTEIAKSDLFRFTEKAEIRLQLRFRSQEVMQANGAPLTIYSIAFTLAHSKQTGDQSVFLGQTVNHCGKDELEKSAKSILKDTIGARAAIQERILAIIDGRIRSIEHSYSAN